MWYSGIATFCFLAGVEPALFPALRFTGVAITEDTCNWRGVKMTAKDDLNRNNCEGLCEIERLFKCRAIDCIAVIMAVEVLLTLEIDTRGSRNR